MPSLTSLVSPLLLAAAVHAAPHEKRGMAQVIGNCNHGFAYTWDDGPYQWNTQLVNKFDSRGAKTTFFMNGDNWSCIYDQANVDRIRYAYERNHQIAHHTWKHAHLTQLSEAQIDEQIQRLDEAFVKILGVKPNIFRPPYGEIDERTANYIQTKHGKTIVLWDLDSGDTAGGASQQGSIDFYYGLAARGPGSGPHMTLSHEVQAHAANAALQSGTVDALANAGYSLITVASCLDIPAYTTVTGNYGNRDNTWTCSGSWTPTNPGTPPPATCKSRYTSRAGDTCASIEAANNLVSGTILQANSFLNCNDIWANTPICVPDGPYNTTPPTNPPTNPPTSGPGCTQQTYTSKAGDTCASIETANALASGAVKASNSFVTCTDIWANTPLSICVPSLGPNDNPTCTRSITVSGSATTCAAVGAANGGVSAAWIKAWNSFVNCGDIWTGTSLCVAH